MRELGMEMKKEILDKLEGIDKYSEFSGLSIVDRQEKKDPRQQLNRLLKHEEVKWMQRCKETVIKEGDASTIYFQAIANGRRRKNKIVSLEQDEGVIEGE